MTPTDNPRGEVQMNAQWRVVPVEPTHEMLGRGLDCLSAEDGPLEAEYAYRAMFQASPAPEGLREVIAEALTGIEVGYHIKLESLVDGVSTYTLDYGFGEAALTFGSHAEALEHVQRRKRLAMADSILKLLTGDGK